MQISSNEKIHKQRTSQNKLRFHTRDYCWCPLFVIIFFFCVSAENVRSKNDTFFLFLLFLGRPIGVSCFPLYTNPWRTSNNFQKQLPRNSTLVRNMSCCSIPLVLWRLCQSCRVTSCHVTPTLVPSLFEQSISCTCVHWFVLRVAMLVLLWLAFLRAPSTLLKFLCT